VPMGIDAGESTLPFDILVGEDGDRTTVRCGVSICFEGILSATGDDLQGDRAQLHVNITEDLWYGRSSAPTQHLALVALRAVESGVPVTRVANGGVSASIDGFGRILESVPLGTKEIGVFEVRVPTVAPSRSFGRIFSSLFPWLAPMALAAVWVRRKRSS